jgi:dissimilatory sulfite reductase (desulfoviridin) alpha/beta subunit
MVRSALEEQAEMKGAQTVTLGDLREARARFQTTVSGKSENDIGHMMPEDNRPGVSMVIVEACHNEMSACPNPLIQTSEWKHSLEQWARENNISERLRTKVNSDRIRYHNRFRISISGCPNSCSRPQIADIGLAGSVCPEFVPAECSSCGSCAQVCPDSAIWFDGDVPRFALAECQGCKACSSICPQECIYLSEPSVRITVGGKLGRHPHLGEIVGEATEPKGAVAIIDSIVNDYIEWAEPGERFADYWLRQGRTRFAGNGDGHRN